MGRGHLSKVMVAGNNRTAYDFTFKYVADENQGVGFIRCARVRYGYF